MIIKKVIAILIIITYTIIVPGAIIYALYTRHRNKKKQNIAQQNIERERFNEINNTQIKIERVPINESNNTNTYNNQYQPRYLLTINEKNQFKKIIEWAKPRGLLVFTKVRLMDIVTPRNENNYRTLHWKIQAKHVDFIICDSNIRIKGIIEIEDNSHKAKDRKERDKFVKEVLESCGYKYLQTYNITQNELDRLCGYNNDQD